MARPRSSPSTRRFCCASRIAPTRRASTAPSAPTCARRQNSCKNARPEGGPRLFHFGEPAGDEVRERLNDLFGLAPGRLDRNGRARPRGEHHQAHDRGAADAFLTARDLHVGIEFFDGLHELGRSARVQALLVADFKLARDRLRRSWLGRCHLLVQACCDHLPVRTRLAMVMYLRPESCAAATASDSGHSSRTLASFTSMGRLIPASTSTLGRLMTEIARLEGVPPNMSTRMATPCPLSTRLTASMISLRHRSASSSAPIVTASICFCGPITCSSAALNSSARRPWVISTRPIIGNSSRGAFGAPHERATLTIRSPHARGDLRDS